MPGGSFVDIASASRPRCVVRCNVKYFKKRLYSKNKLASRSTKNRFILFLKVNKIELVYKIRRTSSEEISVDQRDVHFLGLVFEKMLSTEDAALAHLKPVFRTEDSK